MEQDSPRNQPVLDAFTCIGPACGDTCCAGWSMQVDDETWTRWQSLFPAAELAALTSTDADAGRSMARREGACVALDQGWCRLHAAHGHDVLSKACGGFPRRVASFADGSRLRIAQLACPEIARLALDPTSDDNIGPPAPAGEGLKAVMARLATDAPADQRMRALTALTGSVARFAETEKPAAAAALARSILDRLPQPVRDPLDEPRLLLTAGALVHATGGVWRPALGRLTGRLEAALGMTLDRTTLALDIRGPDDPDALRAARDAAWRRQAAPSGLARMLDAWIDHQLLASPHAPAAAPLPTTTPETLPGIRLAVTFAITALAARAAALDLDTDAALQAEEARAAFAADAAVIARLFEHLSRPALIDVLATECGWNSAGRIHGLLSYTMLT
ncbi:flagellin lysine-N-methylase [Tistrella mobilis]|jgi:lysine-N-methylase